LALAREDESATFTAFVNLPGPRKLSTAQGWIFVMVMALPGMAWTTSYWVWRLIPPKKALAVLSWEQIGWLELGAFVVILLAACLFNAWSVVTVQVEPGNRRRQFVKLVFVLLAVQLLITPLVVGVIRQLLDPSGVF